MSSPALFAESTKENTIFQSKAALAAAAAVLTVFAGSYWPVFEKIFIRWKSPDNSYCLLVFPLFLYLCWEKKNTVAFDRFSWSPWGLWIVLGSSIFLVLGELGSVESFLYFGLWLAAVGTAAAFYGSRTKTIAFPLVILFFFIPLPFYFNQMLTFQLKLAASNLAVFLLRISGFSVLQEGNLIDLGVDQMQMIDACSGLRFFMPLIPTSLLIGYFFSRGWWRKSLLVLLALPISVLANGIRVYATGVLRAGGYPELSEHFFHYFSGWLVFMVAASLLTVLAKILNRCDRASFKKAAASRSTDSQTPAFVPPAKFKRRLWTPVFLILVFGATGWALHQLPKAQASVERTPFLYFPMEIDDWTGRRHSFPQKILDELWADDYLNAEYVHKADAAHLYLLIPFYQRQNTMHTAHVPQACLLGNGWQILAKNRVALAPPNAQVPKLPFLHYVKNDARMLGTYFFFQRGRVITNPWWNKVYLFWDAITRKRTDGALVRVELFLPKAAAYEDAYDVLAEFIAELLCILPDYVPE